jgi:hypothetical protein
MITDQDQLDALTQSTADLIEEDGLDVALWRVTFVPTPSGGVKRVDPEAPLAAVRRFFGSVTATPSINQREEGEFTLYRFVLIGMPGDDIEEHDYFLIDGQKYQVDEIDTDTAWQKKAWCSRRA